MTTTVPTTLHALGARCSPHQEGDWVSSIDLCTDQLMAAPVGRHDDDSPPFRNSGVEYTDRFVQLDLVEGSPCFRSMVKDRQCVSQKPADAVEVQSFRMQGHVRA